MARTRSILRLELGFKKLAIADAMALLREEQARGATHVAGMRVRWEETAVRPLGKIRAAVPIDDADKQFDQVTREELKDEP